jgi:aspartyl-tRNA(Asn)/glutamyl-tRNA(Gln) amidotransferase subunit A
MNEDLAYLSIAELIERYRARSLSPVEVTKAVLARIDAWNGSVNAYSIVANERALSDARASEKRWMRGEPQGAIDGVPISVKDTLMARGFPFRRGSIATPDTPATESAGVAENAERAGAALLGITTTSEFGAAPVTISPLTGITRNPWNLEKNSGGSSGGAAASVAAGMGHAALSTDAGGSTRIPSSQCGVVGFKPTGGRFPTYPPNPIGTVFSPGVVARSVRDVAIMVNALSQPDVRDPEMLPPSGIDYAAAIEDARKPARGVKIAFTTTLGYAPKVDPQVAALVERAAREFEALGYIVEEAHPQVDNPAPHFLTMFRAGFAHTLRTFSDEQMARISPMLRDAVEQGGNVTVAQYLAAHDARRAVARKLQAFHGEYALLLTPTVAVPAFTADRWFPEDFEGLDSRAWTPFVSIFNMTQQPAISVPCGLTAERLPVGLQIVGARFADAEVLRAAHLYETTRATPIGRPPAVQP